MDANESSAESAQQVTWPLIGSLLLTGVVVALVCVPPFSGLHSFGRLVSLACVYMLVAACVHALAVWSIYRIQSEGVREWALKRAPVHETLTFEIPRGDRHAFNEITVKVKPEMGRKLAAPEVAVESFAFQR